MLWDVYEWNILDIARNSKKKIFLVVTLSGEIGHIHFNLPSVVVIVISRPNVSPFITISRNVFFSSSSLGIPYKCTYSFLHTISKNISLSPIAYDHPLCTNELKINPKHIISTYQTFVHFT